MMRSWRHLKGFAKSQAHIKLSCSVVVFSQTLVISSAYIEITLESSSVLVHYCVYLLAVHYIVYELVL